MVVATFAVAMRNKLEKGSSGATEPLTNEGYLCYDTIGKAM